jgi:hypothetical protein
MERKRYRVSPREVAQMGRDSWRQLRRSGAVGILVGTLLQVFLFTPMQFAACFGLVRGTTPQNRPNGPDPDSGGFAGVGARLPVLPPSISGSAAKPFPPAEE